MLLRQPLATLLRAGEVVILLRALNVTALNVAHRHTLATRHFPHTLLPWSSGQALVLPRKVVTCAGGVPGNGIKLNFREF